MDEILTEEAMAAAIRAEQSAYVKAWRKKNPERAKAINRRYWEKKVKAKLAAQAEAANTAQE